ncbi:MAG: SDR family NAD(P)-dependent oxidoreductase [Nocardiopsaceae bacterium]|nr:SDR family NAD(P)-dependent oxidoreductase [Nocardiopsaceae bacterium]
MTDDISGEVAIVTGASRGLGLALARELGQRSARLVICARSADALNEAAADLRASGAEVTAVPCDLRDPEAAALLVDTAIRAYGRLDIVVNNAGIIQVGPVRDAEFADFQAAVDTMALAPVRLTLTALPVMRRQGHGRIVTVTSLGGKISVPHLLPYCTAKFAAVAFSEGLRAELGAGPVSVTTAVPGLMRTGSHLRALFRGQREKEFTWFSLGAALPLVSMDASRAARRIVSAMCDGQAEVILTPTAQVVARTAGIFPGLTIRLLRAFAATLPRSPQTAGPGPELSEGRHLRPAIPQGLFDRVTALARTAARRLNETS